MEFWAEYRGPGNIRKVSALQGLSVTGAEFHLILHRVTVVPGHHGTATQFNSVSQMHHTGGMQQKAFYKRTRGPELSEVGSHANHLKQRILAHHDIYQ